mgnify:CR=1 FL=1
MPIGAGAVIGLGASILGGVFGASSAKKAAQAAAREKRRLQNKLNNLEKNRQEVVKFVCSALTLKYSLLF